MLTTTIGRAAATASRSACASTSTSTSTSTAAATATATATGWRSLSSTSLYWNLNLNFNFNLNWMGSRQPLSSAAAATQVRWASGGSGGGGKKKKKKKEVDPDVLSQSYLDRKQASKQYRVQQYQARLDRREALKSRRTTASSSSSSTKDALKLEFQEWWSARRAREQQWDRQARQAKKEWKMQVSVVLERLPKVLPDTPEWQRDMDELTAYLQQFGKAYPQELLSTTSISGGSGDNDRVAPITDEELIAMLPEGFRPAPRITAADKSGATDTLDRRLTDRVYYLVDGQWPTIELKDDETLVEAAQRVLRRAHTKSAGDDDEPVQVYTASNAPFAVRMTKHNEKDKDNEIVQDSKYFGTKTFFIKLQHDEGSPPIAKGSVAAWLDRSEVVKQLLVSKEENEEGVDNDAFFYRYLL